LSTIGNLRGKGRFNEDAVQAILKTAMENVSAFAAMGGIIAPGTDAGAWAVPHGSLTEYELLHEAIGGSTMAKHELPDTDVAKVTYENGTVVYVNYRRADTVVDGVTIPALGYMVKGGDAQ
jgi:hypothetical protein